MAYWALEALDGSKTALSSLDRVSRAAKRFFYPPPTTTTPHTFFFNDTSTTEIYTILFVVSFRFL